MISDAAERLRNYAVAPRADLAEIADQIDRTVTAAGLTDWELLDGVLDILHAATPAELRDRFGSLVDQAGTLPS